MNTINTIIFCFLLFPVLFNFASASEITGTINQGQENLEARTADLEAGILPGTISDLSASTGNDSGKVNLSWSISYPLLPEIWEVKYSTSEITLENYNSANSYSQDWLAASASATVSGLTPGVKYYFAMKGISGSLKGEMSNIASAAASSSSSGGGGGTSGGGSYSPPAQVSSSNSSLTITSAQKGTLVQKLNDKNEIKIEIPAGSVASSTTFTAKTGALAEGDKPKNKTGAFLFDGLVFNIEAVDASGNAVRNFSQDLVITLSAPNLPDDASGLGIYYFDEKASEWTLVAGAIFGKNTIIFKINHLTKFAVFKTGGAETGSDSKTPYVKGVSISEIAEGDIIQCKTCADPFAVYIVKIVGSVKYIRHIVNIEIFNHYRHLKWENLKQVNSLGDYSMSGWVRVNTGPNGSAGPADKVYEINGDQTKHWINMTAEQFLLHGGSEPAIYNINDGELNLYAAGPDVIML